VEKRVTREKLRKGPGQEIIEKNEEFAGVTSSAVIWERKRLFWNGGRKDRRMKKVRRGKGIERMT